MKKLLVVLLLAVLMLSGCNAITESKLEIDLEKAYLSNDFDSIVKTIEKAEKFLKDNDGSYLVWEKLGWVYIRMDDFEKADMCFNKSLELKPDLDNAYVGKGIMYRKMGDNDKARQSYLKAIEVLPENPEAYSSLSVIEFLEENYEKAIEYGEKAWQLNNESPIFAANLSMAYHYHGAFDKRDELYEEAKKLQYGSLEVLTDMYYSE